MPDDPAPSQNRLLGTFRSLGVLLTSTTAIAAALMFFGFLSQSALYRFLGVPQIANDYWGWVEFGANGIVDSMRLAVTGSGGALRPGWNEWLLIYAAVALWAAGIELAARAFHWRAAASNANGRWRASALVCGIFGGLLPLSWPAVGQIYAGPEELRTILSAAPAAIGGVLVAIGFLLLVGGGAIRAAEIPAVLLVALALAFGIVRGFRLDGSLPPIELWWVAALAWFAFLIPAGWLSWRFASAVRTGRAEENASIDAYERPSRRLLLFWLPLVAMIVAAFGALRGAYLTGVIASFLLLWLFARANGLDRWLREPSLLLVAHVAYAGFVAFVLWQGIAVTGLVGDDGREELRVRIREARRAVVARVEERQFEHWKDIEENLIGNRLGWLETLGPSSPLRFLAERQAINAERAHGAVRGGDDRFEVRPRLYRYAGRELFGWYVALVLVAAGMLVVLHRWRRWVLPADGGSDEETQKRVAASEHVRDAVRIVLHPLLLAAMCVVFALVPAMHGYLAVGYFGQEMVLVSLRQVDDAGNLCSPDPSSSWLKPEDRRSIDEVLRRKAPAKPPPEHLLGAQTPCGDDLPDLNASIKAFGSARERLGTVRTSEREEYDSAMESYRNAARAMFDEAVAARCPEALRKVLAVAPNGLADTEASQLYWSLWRDYRRMFASFRSGYLLRYPTAAGSDRLVLFTPHNSPLPWEVPLRVSLSEIRKDCIEEAALFANEALPVSDLDRGLATLERNPDDTEFLEAVSIYPGPRTLDLLRDAYQRDPPVLGAQQLAVATTRLGLVAGLLGEREEGRSRRAVEALFRRIEENYAVDESSDPAVSKVARWKDREIVASAFTALHLTKRPSAAVLLLRKLEDPVFGGAVGEIGTAVTSAGFLAGDLAAQCRRDSVLTALCRDDGVLSTDGVETWLDELVADPTNRYRAAACTAMGLVRSESSRRRIIDRLTPMLEPGNRRNGPKEDPNVVGACLTQLTGGLPKELRERVRQLADGRLRRFVPETQLRGAAIESLYRNGMAGLGGWLARVVASDTDPFIRQKAAFHLNDVDPDDVLPPVIECVERESASNAICIRAIALTGELADGDDRPEMVALLADRATAPDASGDEACTVLRELAARGGRTAERAIEKRCGERGDSFPDTPYDRRWQLHHTAISNLLARTMGDPLVSSAETPIDRLLFGNDEEQEDVRRVARTPDPDDPGYSERALQAVLQIDESLRSELLPRVFMEEDPGLRVFHAGQYLEDVPGDSLAPALLGCATDEKHPAARRLRCLLGLALLGDDFHATGDFVTNVRAIEAPKGEEARWNDVRCRAIEQLRRSTGGMEGGKGGPDPACTAVAAGLREDRDERWLQNVRALTALLVSEAEATNADDGVRRRLREALAAADAVLTEEVPSPGNAPLP